MPDAPASAAVPWPAALPPASPAPTLAAARARIAAVQPGAYARTRNALGGAVTGLSPYLTHGLVTLPEVLGGVLAREPLELQHSFVRELGWRAYFRHVWAQRGAGILDSLHEGPLPDAAYGRELPADVREARTGVPAIDAAVRELYTTGLLHNHARLWLASYLVHLRQVHWRCGADWLIGHLLDGDLASNHLSWQWVAGTGSSKPYLFNADNVARHAPAAWHSAGSEIDLSYEALERRAHTPERRVRPAAPARHLPSPEPPCFEAPPAELGAVAPNAAAVQGRDVWLVHPWSLGELPDDLAPGTVVIGLWLADFHSAWPWTARRWHFVGERLAELAPRCWHGDAPAVAAALAGALSVGSVDEPHLAPWLRRLAGCRPAPALFPHVVQPCTSFSRWWTQSTRGLRRASELLEGPAAAA